DGIVERPATLHPVRSGKADGEGQFLRPNGTDGAHGLHYKPAAVYQTAAVQIVAAVGERGEERMREVSVRGMQFQPEITRLHRADRGCAKGILDVKNLLDREVVGRRIARPEWHCARPHTFPAALFGAEAPAARAAKRSPGAGLAPRMRELHARYGPVSPNEARDAPERFDLLVAP